MTERKRETRRRKNKEGGEEKERVANLKKKSHVHEFIDR